MQSDTLIPQQVNNVRRKKLAILGCGVLLYFLTCMAKVLIPGAIFDDLRNAGLDSNMISATGAAFMYAYAASQLLAGIFSNRYGGVRILFAGGSLFSVGTLFFPWCSNFHLMIFCRIITGLGAGTVFLGVVKLLDDLFSEKFAMALGTVMLCSYFGPSFGTTPMVLLTALVGWKTAMSIPGAMGIFGIFIITIFMHGTLKPVNKCHNFEPVKAMLKNKQMWLLNCSVPIIFGAYYILTSQIGQKSIIDHCSLSPAYASTIIMLLTFMVALNNVGVNMLLKLCHEKRKIVAIIAFCCTILGALAGYFAFSSTHSVIAVTVSFILIAIPAGFFPLFSTIAKEINPPEQTGLAVALLNFWCFVFIAAFQNITGRILQADSIAGSLAYTPQTYCRIFIFIGISGIAGLILCNFYKETCPAK